MAHYRPPARRGYIEFRGSPIKTKTQWWGFNQIGLEACFKVLAWIQFIQARCYDSGFLSSTTYKRECSIILTINLPKRKMLQYFSLCKITFGTPVKNPRGARQLLWKNSSLRLKCITILIFSLKYHFHGLFTTASTATNPFYPDLNTCIIHVSIKKSINRFV